MNDGGTLARRLLRGLPRTFQGRLSVAFVLVFALALGLVSSLTLFVLNNYLYSQEQQNLDARAQAVAFVVQTEAQTEADAAQGNGFIVTPDNRLEKVVADLFTPLELKNVANQVALADVRLRFGLPGYGGFSATRDGRVFSAALDVQPRSGETRDKMTTTRTFLFEPKTASGLDRDWVVEVTLSNPYTYRATTMQSVAGFLALVSAGALLVAILVASLLASRFTIPLRRLTEASRAIAEGDLNRRVPSQGMGAVEITELSQAFNTMGARVQETMEVTRRDRDRSREFLADVSHELRTPLAALRTFNELLQESAGEDPAARTEFLEASAQQLERLDWLAQNLLELSKLDSGLIRLDLRPEDVRATVQSAVEQAEAAARRRGVALTTQLPDGPLRIRHDPQRIGQVVSNLVGNALKFTPRSGSVLVSLTPFRGGARIEIVDTGVGIDASELPHIFERFYRGSRANEARSSGSGLGLAIVRSIVEMHGGRVAVESRLGAGSTFTVTLPADPRLTASSPGGPAAAVPADGAVVANRGPGPRPTSQTPAPAPAQPPQAGPAMGLSGAAGPGIAGSRPGEAPPR